MSAKSEQLRTEWKVNDAKRDAGLTTPEDVKRFDDIQYGPDVKWNVLDVYRPKKEEGILPVIVSIHGGGWVYGDKELYQFYCMGLAQKGFAVVNFTYRLAPENKYPAQMEDINLVMEWVFRNAEAYGLDLDHIFLVGDSAGGHMAGIYSCICTNPDYAKKYAFKVPKGFVPKAVALNCGAYVPILPGEESKAGRTDQDRELMDDLLPGGGTEEEAMLINVTEHITAAFPPVFFMTSVGDFCRPQAPYLEEALKENGVAYEFHLYGTEEEPLYHVFHLNMREEIGKKCNGEECAFFRKFL